MGRIVFSVIVDNIKSFFVKEKELSAQPKKIPEAASEVFEKPKIVDKPLPKLPFSPEQLRVAVKEPPKEQAPPVPAPRPEAQIQEHITHEIAAFETALRDVQTKPAVQILKSAGVPRVPTTYDDPLFFAEFEQFVTKEQLESQGLLEKDIVWRMKEFHRHRQEGKEYYLYSQDAKSAIQRRIDELKSLEHEWFKRRSDADSLEREMQFIEHDIENRAHELKALLKQASEQSKLEQRAPQGHEFQFADGTKVATVLELRKAIHRMSDDTYAIHVANGRNDFAAWIRSIMNDHTLANKLEQAKSKGDTERILGGN